MTEANAEIVLQRACEKFPKAKPRIISNNGPQFVAKSFKEYIRVCGMTHVRTALFHPESNGKIERWNKSLKTECIRPGTPLSLEDARRLVDRFVRCYNDERLHSAIGYVTPKDKLEGREVMWLSLDEEDSDPTGFLAYFIAAMLLKLHRFRIRANVQITDPIKIEKE